MESRTLLSFFVRSKTCDTIVSADLAFELLSVLNFSLNLEMSRLTRDGTVKPVSRYQFLRHGRGQGNIHFPCSADNEQDWQP